jgi:type I restriction enzyme, S subunit
MPENTVLFTSRAPIGYIAISNNQITTNQGFKNIICDNEKCNYMYLYYWLKNNVELIKSKANGSTFQEISGNSMKNIDIYMPSLENQKKIATILNNIDSKIELNSNINDNLLYVA